MSQLQQSSRAVQRKAPGRAAEQQGSRRVRQQAVATPTRVRQFTGSGVHVRKGSCELVELQPDCSDLWRLGDVANRLRNGAVRPDACFARLEELTIAGA